MISKHHKLLSLAQPSFDELKRVLPMLGYTPEAERGFSIPEDVTDTRIRAKYYYPEVKTVKRLDPETLEPKEEALSLLTECRFDVLMAKNLVCVDGRRGHLNALYEALDAIPDVFVAFEDLNINLAELMFEVQINYRKNTVKQLRIKDYIARENMLATAGFKVLEPDDGVKNAERFSDQLDAFVLTLKLPDGACSLKVTRKGSISVSDDAPTELLLYVQDLLWRYHEAEVETVEVVNPEPTPVYSQPLSKYAPVSPPSVQPGAR